MPKVLVPVRPDILRAAERRRAAGVGRGVSDFLGDLVNWGFEQRLRDLYKRFQAGELSLESYASELGLGVRELYATLEDRGLPTSNIG